GRKWAVHHDHPASPSIRGTAATTHTGAAETTCPTVQAPADSRTRRPGVATGGASSGRATATRRSELAAPTRGEDCEARDRKQNKPPHGFKVPPRRFQSTQSGSSGAATFPVRR